MKSLVIYGLKGSIIEYCCNLFTNYLHFRISQAIEMMPRLITDKSSFSQSSQLIVMETRSYPRRQFAGVQCTRLDLKFDKTLSRMVQSPTGFLFVCDEPKNGTLARYSRLKVSFSFFLIAKTKVIVVTSLNECVVCIKPYQFDLVYSIRFNLSNLSTH